MRSAQRKVVFYNLDERSLTKDQRFELYRLLQVADEKELSVHFRVGTKFDSDILRIVRKLFPAMILVPDRTPSDELQGMRQRMSTYGIPPKIFRPKDLSHVRAHYS